MNGEKRIWSQHVANLARAAFWFALLAILLLQLLGSRGQDSQRAALLGNFEKERNSRVIAMIHRQESASILGVPVASSISIDDSEAILRAIRLTPPDQPIDLILQHMPEKPAVQLATILSEGRWTHDFPITVQAARQLGLKVSTNMPRGVYDLMDLYPQGGGVRPSVLYVPIRRTAAPGKAPQEKSAPGQP